MQLSNFHNTSMPEPAACNFLQNKACTAVLSFFSGASEPWSSHKRYWWTKPLEDHNTLWPSLRP